MQADHFHELMNCLHDRALAAAYIRAHPASLTATSLSGETVLHWLALEDSHDDVAFLAAQGADVNQPDCSGATPLHTVAIVGHGAMTRLLLQLGADPSRLDQNGDTPLHIAATHAHPAALRALLAGGAHPDTDGLPEQPLHQLLSAAAHVPPAIPSVLDRATPEFRRQLEADPALLAQLTRNLPQPKDPADHLTCLRLLLGAGANINARGFDGTRPVMLAAACANHHPELLEELLHHDPDLSLVDDEGHTSADHLDPAARSQFLSRLQRRPP